MFIDKLLCDMENKSKSYFLVAWTENGQVRMIPSLVNELKLPYEEKIARIESLDYENEVGWLIARSRAWEEYARFFLNLGYFRQAYQCYEIAAGVCSFCSDIFWVQDENSERPVLPLYHRFLSMHNRCKWLIRQHPVLGDEYRGSDLENSYLFYSSDDRRREREFNESYESMKAWHFGHSR